MVVYYNDDYCIVSHDMILCHIILFCPVSALSAPGLALNRLWRVCVSNT